MTPTARADVVAAGAGPAGITAAIAAARRGRSVVLLEKAARPGVKILVSGGNRCNLTHDCDAATIAKAFGREGARFLGPALRELGPRELRAWIESLGVPTKVEPGGKVFPVSNRAVDVRDALERELARAHADFRGSCVVRAIEAIERTRDGSSDDTNARFILRAGSLELAASRVILAAGGRSYPRVGTTGDGYALARALGHTIVATTPALVPLVVETPWVRDLSGLTLDDVEIALEMPRDVDDSEPRAPAVHDAEPPSPSPRPPPRARAPGSPSSPVRTLDQRRGGFLFTHFGLSGPAPMNLGGAVAPLEREAAPLANAPAPAGSPETPHAPLARARLRIDFLPARRRAELETELDRIPGTRAAGSRPVRAWLAELLPRRLADALLANSSIPSERALAQLSKPERERIPRHALSPRACPSPARAASTSPR